MGPSVRVTGDGVVDPGTDRLWDEDRQRSDPGPRPLHRRAADTAKTHATSSTVTRGAPVRGDARFSPVSSHTKKNVTSLFPTSTHPADLRHRDVPLPFLSVRSGGLMGAPGYPRQVQNPGFRRRTFRLRWSGLSKVDPGVGGCSPGVG